MASGIINRKRKNFVNPNKSLIFALYNKNIFSFLEKCVIMYSTLF